MEELVIPARFNGPPESGNGGYSCGAVADFVDGSGAAVTVRLHAPPPLDRPLQVTRGDGARVEVRDGETLVASGRPGELALAIPGALTLDQARRGRERFPCYEHHPMGTCFVCGPHRPAKDGLEIFTGPVGESGIVACSWRPAAEFLDASGSVRPGFVWAALDCPGGFAALGNLDTPLLLGELTLARYAPVPGDEELVVFAWPEGREGRKHYGGTAVATADGRVLACALTTWIALG
jgi:acyl-coenzyme A thioesterase PaaI-like protein